MTSMEWHFQSKVGRPDLNQYGLMDQAVEAGSAIKTSTAGSASTGKSTYAHLCLPVPPSLSCCASVHAWILLQSRPHLYYRFLVLLHINSTKNTQKPAIKHGEKNLISPVLLANLGQWVCNSSNKFLDLVNERQSESEGERDGEKAGFVP